MPTVDRAGAARPRAAAWELDWWIGADDRWHVPAARGRGPPAPGRRHAGGPDRDAGAGRRRGAARVRRAGRRRRRGRGRRDRQRVAGARSSSRWSCAARARVDLAERHRVRRRPERAAHGAAAVALGADRRRHDRGARDERGRRPTRRSRRAATAARASSPRSCTRSRTARRCAPSSRSGTRGLGAVEPAALPDAAAVARGWRAQLDRGMRVELPDDALQRAVADRARGDRARRSGVAGRSRGRRRARGLGPRRRGGGGVDAARPVARAASSAGARRRPTRRGPRCGRGRRDPTPRSSPRCGRWSCARPTTGSRSSAEWPTEWIGQPFDVRDAPTRRGPVSYSVRWHGDRPALLWEAPDGHASHRARPRPGMVDRRAARRGTARRTGPAPVGRSASARRSVRSSHGRSGTEPSNGADGRAGEVDDLAGDGAPSGVDERRDRRVRATG